MGKKSQLNALAFIVHTHAHMFSRARCCLSMYSSACVRYVFAVQCGMVAFTLANRPTDRLNSRQAKNKRGADIWYTYKRESCTR